MSKILYVVCERSFEYNDEIYHLPNDGSGDESGVPKTAYKTKKAALSERDKQNLDWFKSIITPDEKYHNVELNSYTYDSIEKLFNVDILKELSVEITKTEYEEKFLKIPEDFSDKNYIKLMNSSSIDLPWIVSEVEYEDT